MYELVNNTLLGSVEIKQTDEGYNDSIFSIKIYKNGLNVLLGTLSGLIYMMRIEQHIPLKVRMTTIVDVKLPICDISISTLDHRYIWLCASQSNFFHKIKKEGYVKVWSRKN